MDNDDDDDAEGSDGDDDDDDDADGSDDDDDVICSGEITRSRIPSWDMPKKWLVWPLVL